MPSTSPATSPKNAVNLTRTSQNPATTREPPYNPPASEVRGTVHWPCTGARTSVQHDPKVTGPVPALEKP
jgi:hypothetical protein